MCLIFDKFWSLCYHLFVWCWKKGRGQYLYSCFWEEARWAGGVLGGRAREYDADELPGNLVLCILPLVLWWLYNLKTLAFRSLFFFCLLARLLLLLPYCCSNNLMILMILMMFLGLPWALIANPMMNLFWGFRICLILLSLFGYLVWTCLKAFVEGLSVCFDRLKV